MRLKTFERWAGVGLAVALGIFIGASAFTFTYAEGHSYLTNDPQACLNCHVMREQFYGWLKSSHHAVATCNDCHVPTEFLGKWYTKIDHGYRHSKGFTFNDFHEPIQIKEHSLEVVQNNCVRCHQETVSMMTTTLPHGGDIGQQLNCVMCHSGIGHGGSD